ncbi:hypothetical protein Droror1_Dr00027234 [Drosera rotundifolia]
MPMMVVPVQCEIAFGHFTVSAANTFLLTCGKGEGDEALAVAIEVMAVHGWEEGDDALAVGTEVMAMRGGLRVEGERIWRLTVSGMK